MLARTLKSAAELGLAEHEYNALCTTLYMMEDGQIPMNLIYMGAFHEKTHCGTTHCLAGWANHFDATAFPEIAPGLTNVTAGAMKTRLPEELIRLFGMNTGMPYMANAPADKAIAALRTYLETGRCD
jgi:hypothetical protein